MRLNVEMTLSAETAQRFRDVAERLGHSDHDEDGLFAAAILLRIADSYDRAAAGQSLAVDQLNAENDE
jgi:hypothetical protein